jgi:hypothetical protein
MTAGSARLAIIEQALTDTLARLDELPESPRVRALRARATGYRLRVRGWQTMPPSDPERTAMVDLVLELNIAVMRAAEEAGVA